MDRYSMADTLNVFWAGLYTPVIGEGRSNNCMLN